LIPKFLIFDKMSIRLENITKTFSITHELSNLIRQRKDSEIVEDLPQKEGNKIYVLKDINLYIPEGKTLSIIGPSGCGKTTLLKVIAGLEKPDSGDVYFNEEKVTNLSPSERKIGMVFQDYALYPHYAAKGNLSFPFWIKKTPQEEIDEKIKETAEILGVGFEYLLPKKPKELSGGEKQRVAVGRCIIRNPSVMLFDEPLSNLDTRLRVQTRVQIKKLLLRFQVTSVYVTHDQNEAIAIGDIIGVMHGGRILQVGTYEELTENPTHSFVASFVGNPPMNLIEGKISGSIFYSEGRLFHLPFSFQEGEYILGFHAKDIKINPHGAILGEVFFIDSLPSDKRQVLHVDLGKTVIKIETENKLDVRVGDKISFDLPEKIYLFKKDSGERIKLRGY